MEDKITCNYSIFNTSFGLCGIALSENGVVKFILPGMTKDEIVSAISHEQLVAKNRKNKAVEDSIKRYFDGESVDFNFPLDLSCMTDFQKKAYEITRTIPYGEVRTYKWVAKKIGLPDASRAVGGALSRNPIPLLIPCHRVVREDGGMGGFTAHGGIGLKIKMIELESKSLKV